MSRRRQDWPSARQDAVRNGTRVFAVDLLSALRTTRRTGTREVDMDLVAGIVALLLLIYLVVALIHPERFG